MSFSHILLLSFSLQKSVKEGILLKQTSSFQRWKRRYFKLRGRTLYYAKDCKSLIFDEVDLSDASVAETSTKNINNSFTVITPFRKLMLCAESRKEMEDWITALKSVQKWETYEVSASGTSGFIVFLFSFSTVCKFKAHKRCAVRSTNNCKWTTLASIGNDIIEDEDGVSMPHQWLEGNLPVSAKCVVCDKNCGSVRRLQDWRCLWCKAIVHNSCREQMRKVCPLGQCRVSIIPPTALNSIDSDGFWKATSASCSSPLLVLVNSKSGDNQGVKFLRRFKQLLNPAQVFDLMNGGPELGLRLFQKFVTFRILVCGGDGSVGWVLSELDKLNLHKQCQLGVLPLGTGNDLARVLGWGGLCDDDAQLLQILEKLERATTKMFLCGTVNDFVAEVGKAYERATENKVEADVMAKKVFSPVSVCVCVRVQCSEKCVMNNYFGIGLDAKISLEFNNKRDEHPKNSRTKNMMWYGVLGTKELVQKTYKNLEQRVQLECDGVPISLPSLQGLAVLNIPSYAGGINFWGGTKEDNNYGAPSFDDKKLEVVAVFGSMQMAMSRVINLQHHRIAQCRQVKITILGEEGVPVQVDGEAWIQPPGIVKIVHRNRAQMLTRDRAFESTLKSWEDKRKFDSDRDTRPRLNSQQSMEYLTEEECAQVQQLGFVADTLINKVSDSVNISRRIREAAKTHKLVEQELAHAVNATALVLTEAKLSSPEVRH
uniref:Diacylglycerol kinase n=1 Tax=Gouania willdenowi TaxID=441366 RepID=A0A8C5DT72_GOUWI